MVQTSKKRLAVMDTYKSNMIGSDVTCKKEAIRRSRGKNYQESLRLSGISSASSTLTREKIESQLRDAKKDVEHAKAREKRLIDLLEKFNKGGIA